MKHFYYIIRRALGPSYCRRCGTPEPSDWIGIVPRLSLDGQVEGVCLRCWHTEARIALEARWQRYLAAQSPERRAQLAVFEAPAFVGTMEAYEMGLMDAAD